MNINVGSLFDNFTCFLIFTEAPDGGSVAIDEDSIVSMRWLERTKCSLIDTSMGARLQVKERPEDLPRLQKEAAARLLQDSGSLLDVLFGVSAEMGKRAQKLVDDSDDWT